MQGSITFNQRFKWMWVDEYTWAFLYNENIDIRDNSQGFRLANKFSKHYMFTEGNEIIWTLKYKWWDVYITRRWIYWGMYTPNNEWPYFLFDDSYAWDFVLGGWNRLFFLFEENRVGIFELWNSLEDIDWWHLHTGDIIDDNWVRTPWTWWSLDWGVYKHTEWETDNLKITIDPTSYQWERWHINVGVRNWTKWTLKITYRGKTSRDSWDVWVLWWWVSLWVENYWWASTYDIEITPSSDFDWEIIKSKTKALVYNRTKYRIQSALGTAFWPTPMCDWLNVYFRSEAENRTNIRTLNIRQTISTFPVYEKALSLPKSDNIMAMTEIGSLINIYVNTENDAIKYFWDWVSNIPEEKIVFKNSQFVDVYNHWNIDYAIMDDGRTRWLYVMNGYNREPIVINKPIYKDYEQSKKNPIPSRLYFEKIIWMYWNIIYLATKNWILSRGTRTTWLPQSFSKETEIIEDISIWKNFIIKNNDTKQSWIWTLNKFIYQNSWYIITTPIIVWKLGNEKVLDKVKIGMLLPSDKTKVRVYINANDSQYFTFFSWDTPDVWNKYKIGDNEFEVISVDDFDRSFTTKATIKAPKINSKYLMWISWTLVKVEWTWWDINFYDNNNFVFVKEFTTDKYKYTNDFILSSDLVKVGIENIYKATLKIELISESEYETPEINDITVLATVIDDGSI